MSGTWWRTSDDDSDIGWGEEPTAPEGADRDAQLQAERPPHWG